MKLKPVIFSALIFAAFAIFAASDVVADKENCLTHRGEHVVGKDTYCNFTLLDSKGSIIYPAFMKLDASKGCKDLANLKPRVEYPNVKLCE